MALATEEEQPRSGLVGTRVQGRVALFKARSRPSPPLTIAKRKEQGPWQATGKHHPTASLDWGGDPGATLTPTPPPWRRPWSCSPGKRAHERELCCETGQGRLGTQAASLEAAVSSLSRSCYHVPCFAWGLGMRRVRVRDSHPAVSAPRPKLPAVVAALADTPLTSLLGVPTAETPRQLTLCRWPTAPPSHSRVPLQALSLLGVLASAHHPASVADGTKQACGGPGGQDS